ncbi:MAG: hypothetical protein HY928_12700 [Elusimicrobia bacterium]|nr:hypothetical protein [Elusimicrobiota bacterium]
MLPGRWLSPRHAARDGFERDFPKVELGTLEVYCPGCRSVLRLSRRNPSGKAAGWCNTCARGVCS